jgi:hypothetical protein
LFIKLKTPGVIKGTTTLASTKVKIKPITQATAANGLDEKGEYTYEETIDSDLAEGKICMKMKYYPSSFKSK